MLAGLAVALALAWYGAQRRARFVAPIIAAALRPNRLPAAAFTDAQLTFYAMIVTLSPAVWHPWHFATAPAFGISALADRLLAGGLMWVAGGALFMSIIALMAHRFVLEPDRSAQR